MLSHDDIKQMRRDGYVTFETDIIEKTTLEVANSIGIPATWTNLSKVQSLRPRLRTTVEKSSYSGLYGLDAFPMHTDMAHWWHPPRYILLRCIHAENNVSTHVLKADVIFSTEYPAIRRAAFRPRRPVEGKFFIIHLQEKNFVRWDDVFLEPLGGTSLRIKNKIRDRISEATPQKIFLDKPGKCILIDNWNALHGRSSVNDLQSNRHVERTYLEKITGDTDETEHS